MNENFKNKYSMKLILEQIIDRNTEGNYLLSSSDKEQMISEILGVIDPNPLEDKSKNVENSTTAQTDANTVSGAVKCAEGWHDGSCCCNCKNQIELFKHPWNKVNKGSIMESTGMYACIVQFDCEKEYKGIIFEKKHGMCEMHVRR